MEDVVICECGNKEFFFIGPHVRCTKCRNEYKKTTLWPPSPLHNNEETWLRRYNYEKNKYETNWEKWGKTTQIEA
jgi:hypothetical protein